MASYTPRLVNLSPSHCTYLLVDRSELLFGTWLQDKIHAKGRELARQFLISSSLSSDIP